MRNPFSTDDFLAYLRSTGRCFNHMTEREKRCAIAEYKATQA